MYPVITIDGPSGTGKGTLCHMLAKYLHWHVLDSGVLYRVLAYAAQENGIALNNINALIILNSQLKILFVEDSSNHRQILLNGKNISEVIRSEQCGQNASKIGVIAEVRQALLDSQRAFVKPPGLVADGRDMGTVIFPNARLKLYLDATSEERSKRRYYQLRNQGIDVSLADIMADLIARDTRDAARLAPPLKTTPKSPYIKHHKF